MKKILIVLSVATLGLIAVTVGCDNQTCTSDADCVGTTNAVGDPTPVCDVDLGVCIPEGQEECTEDLDCDLLNPDSATAPETCEANADCPDAGDHCVEDSNGVTYCVAESGGVCGDIGLTGVNFDDIEGNTFEGCSDGGTCEDDGTCTF